MSDTKVCTKCNIVKELNSDNFIYRKNGNYWEGKCRVCDNEERRAKRKGLKYNSTNIHKPNTTTEFKPEYKIERNLHNMFNESEISSLKILAKNHNEIMSIINNKMELSNEDDTINKIKKSITISANTHNKILELLRNSKLNYSQIVDSLLKKALENI